MFIDNINSYLSRAIFLLIFSPPLYVRGGWICTLKPKIESSLLILYYHGLLSHRASLGEVNALPLDRSLFFQIC